ncbi:MAG: spheroidene monooxygenase [Pyrinomonadaceae bacterium]
MTNPLNGNDGNVPLTTLSLFGFSTATNRLWALAQMGLARAEMSRVAGLRFWKLLGSGEGGGFSLRPNFSRYGLLATWESSKAADDFFGDSRLFTAYRRHTVEIWTVRLVAMQSHGAWGGVNPFLPAASPAADSPVAVLTRASIRWNRLRRFWSHVHATSRALDDAEGLLASIGIGEAPVKHQATFSLWRSADAMKAFAYSSPTHTEVIRRTRDEGWYSEELFVRFLPIASEGLWNGRDPLAGLL